MYHLSSLQHVQSVISPLATYGIMSHRMYGDRKEISLLYLVMFCGSLYHLMNIIKYSSLMTAAIAALETVLQ